MPSSFAPVTRTRSRRPRTLIVDDERDSLELYEGYLRNAGWDVSIAETGDGALFIAPILLPDVIVLDLLMPGLDGFQTMQRLKLDPRTTCIPIVVLTGLATKSAQRRAVRTGAEVVLTKPCTPDALEATLEDIVTTPPASPRRQTV
jgi:CheY-like chemotaxis protein